MLHPRIKDVLIHLGLYRPLRKTYRILRGVPLRRHLLPWRTRRFYRQFAGPETPCFDVGANVGIRTAALRTLGARVIAIEPQTTCLEVLHKKFDSDPHVTIEPVALGSEPGTAQLHLVDGASPLASITSEWSSSGPFAHRFTDKTETVAVTTLDELIKRHGTPAFIKIDVEGYEAQVLAGLHHPVPYLSFEYVAKLTRNTKECLDLLVARGFDTFNYSSGETMKWKFPHWVPAQKLLKLLDDAPHSESEWGDIYAHHPMGNTSQN